MNILQIPKYFIHCIVDYIWSNWLQFIRKDDFFITEEKYQHIRTCAASAYPNEELDYSECVTLDELLIQMGCRRGKLYVLSGDTWYFILIREITHVVAYDFASSTGKCVEMLSIYRTLINLFPNKRFFLMCRESTSYPLVKSLERRGDYKILKDERTFRDGEQYHKILLKVNKRNK